MKNNNEEMKQGLDNWVKGLQPIAPEDSLTTRQRMELTAQESGPRQQSDDEACWQNWRRERSARRQGIKSGVQAVHFL